MIIIMRKHRYLSNNLINRTLPNFRKVKYLSWRWMQTRTKLQNFLFWCCIPLLQLSESMEIPSLLPYLVRFSISESKSSVLMFPLQLQLCQCLFLHLTRFVLAFKCWTLQSKLVGMEMDLPNLPLTRSFLIYIIAFCIK